MTLLKPEHWGILFTKSATKKNLFCLFSHEYTSISVLIGEFAFEIHTMYLWKKNFERFQSKQILCNQKLYTKDLIAHIPPNLGYCSESSLGKIRFRRVTTYTITIFTMQSLYKWHRDTAKNETQLRGTRRPMSWISMTTIIPGRLSEILVWFITICILQLQVNS